MVRFKIRNTGSRISVSRVVFVLATNQYESILMFVFVCVCVCVRARARCSSLMSILYMTQK